MQEIKENIYYVGSRHRDRRVFDELVPLSDGTSYNSTIIKGSQKTALIDTVYPAKTQELIDQLKELGIEKLDYIISNHGEQDHSGSIPAILALYPEAKVVTNEKCKELLLDLLDVKEEDFITVKTDDKLDLGDKTLSFYLAPWVHWPDTMFTFLEEDKILFTGDFFGSHITDFELYSDGSECFWNHLKSYYAEIMMPFVKIFRKYFAKIEELNPVLIVPSHGPLHKDPKQVIETYKKWASDEVENKIVVLHTSMYGSTAKMLDYLAQKLQKQGINLKFYEALSLDSGKFAADLVDAAGIIVATPTVLTGPHPNIVGHLYLANAIKPKTQYVSIIGSYSWGGRCDEMIKGYLSNIKGEFFDSVLSKGVPKEPDYAKLDELAEKIIAKHKEIMKL